MEQRRWLNHAHPQTLQSAVILLYINAAFALLALVGTTHPIGIAIQLISVAGGAAGWAMANDRKWGWLLGLGTSIFAVLATLVFTELNFGGLIYLMFRILVVILLLHPMTRAYQKTWFK